MRLCRRICKKRDKKHCSTTDLIIFWKRDEEKLVRTAKDEKKCKLNNVSDYFFKNEGNDSDNFDVIWFSSSAE